MTNQVHEDAETTALEEMVWLKPTSVGVDYLRGTQQRVFWPLKLFLVGAPIWAVSDPVEDRVIQSGLIALMFLGLGVWTIFDEIVCWRRWSSIRLGVAGRQLILIDEAGNEARGDVCGAKVTHTTLWLDEVELQIKDGSNLRWIHSPDVFDPQRFDRHVRPILSRATPLNRRGPINRHTPTQQRLFFTFIFAWFGVLLVCILGIAGSGG
ncbi:MAG: hypothetical protein COX57_07005 [Alphaproteobacteria bacterium CG_4_10_14_0_2_um_filter_63_37]|nr:MAG: hypothetical protein COX57_07005 [Alphaproteobacteria bacterium CG_4_10_14_0_2_um_filter_63_37]